MVTVHSKWVHSECPGPWGDIPGRISPVHVGKWQEPLEHSGHCAEQGAPWGCHGEHPDSHCDAPHSFYLTLCMLHAHFPSTEPNLLAAPLWQPCGKGDPDWVWF